MTTDEDQIQHFRVQRNFAAITAVFFIIISMGVVLPRFLKTRRELSTATQEVIDLQSYIVRTQKQTRETEAEIIQTQREIRKLVQSPQ
jgi:hypothetical protein